MQQFDIYFSGRLLPSTDPDQARQALAGLFKVQGKALEQLFSGTPVRVKKSVDVETAGRFRELFRNAGTLVDIVAAGAPPPAARPAADANPQAGLPQLLPPRTGSLADCQPPIEAAPIPDISWMKLDLPGVTIDETPAAAEPAIDTGALSMGPANSGSLIDCEQPKQAQAIGDIGWMELDLPGAAMDTSPAPPPQQIDTGGMTLGPPNSGSLEDCTDTREAKPIPNIDHLALDTRDS